MADESFDVKKFFDFSPEGWYKVGGLGLKVLLVVLIIVGIISVWHFIFPVPDKQINRPRVVALPGSRVGNVDQSNVQVLMEEKKWSASVGGGVLRWDNRDGWFGGAWVTRKW